MSRIQKIICGAALALSLAGPCWAEVHVTYVKPEQFFDLNQPQRDEILNDLTRHFQTLDKSLAPDQVLNIDVTAIDLSGQVKNRYRTNQINVVKGGADWPTMHLKYRLEAKGQVLRSGEDDLDNKMYLNRQNKYPSNDYLRYEKQMIDDWFRNWLGSAKK